MQSFHQTLDRSTLARVLNMPAWAWRSSACLSMCSSDTQFWSAISMFSCMIILTPSTLAMVLLSWSIWARSSYLAQSFLKSDLHAAVSSDSRDAATFSPHLALKVRLSSSRSAYVVRCPSVWLFPRAGGLAFAWRTGYVCAVMQMKIRPAASAVRCQAWLPLWKL